ncbi:hypothetical protein LSAT2_024691, partial [Lamellibrachia satsuma]
QWGQTGNFSRRQSWIPSTCLSQRNMYQADTSHKVHPSSHHEEPASLQQGKEIEQGQILGTLQKAAKDQFESESRSLGLR